MKKDAGLNNLRWTVRFRPRIVKLPSTNIYWFEEAGLLFFESVEKVTALPLYTVRGVIPFDFYQVIGAVDLGEDAAQARTFFRDLANQLLEACERAERLARVDALPAEPPREKSKLH